MLRYFMMSMGAARFVGHERRDSRGGGEGHLCTFLLSDGSRACIAWCTQGAAEIEPPFPCARATDAFGRELKGPGGRALLGSRPLYLFE